VQGGGGGWGGMPRAMNEGHAHDHAVKAIHVVMQLRAMTVHTSRITGPVVELIRWRPAAASCGWHLASSYCCRHATSTGAHLHADCKPWAPCFGVFADVPGDLQQPARQSAAVHDQADH
jgi:hypothetical protein